MNIFFRGHFHDKKYMRYEKSLLLLPMCHPAPLNQFLGAPRCLAVRFDPNGLVYPRFWKSIYLCILFYFAPSWLFSNIRSRHWFKLDIPYQHADDHDAQQPCQGVPQASPLLEFWSDSEQFCLSIGCARLTPHMNQGWPLLPSLPTKSVTFFYDPKNKSFRRPRMAWV